MYVKKGYHTEPSRMTPEIRAKGAEVRRRNVYANENNIKSMLEIKRYLANGGTFSLTDITRHLNEHGLKTSRGHAHRPCTVNALITRYKITKP